MNRRDNMLQGKVFQGKRTTSGRESTGVDAWVGAAIADRRKGMGWSQAQLAERIGLSFQQVQKYEAGINRISASRLHRIAGVMGTHAGHFFPRAGQTVFEAEAHAPPTGGRHLTETGRLVRAFQGLGPGRERRALLVLAEALMKATREPHAPNRGASSRAEVALDHEASGAGYGAGPVHGGGGDD